MHMFRASRQPAAAAEESQRVTRAVSLRTSDKGRLDSGEGQRLS